jgi:hypothetical protein
MSHQLWNSPIKHGVSPNQLYFLDCCRHKIRPTDIINQEAERSICQAKGLLNEEGKLTEKALSVLEEFETFLVKTKKKVTATVLGEDYLEKIKAYREIFPAVRLPHGELARQSVNELKEKFLWFFHTYPEFNWDLVMEATSFYNYLKEQDGYQYMSTSSYFIQKTDTKTRVVKSILADYCQQILDDPKILQDTTRQNLKT